MECLYPARIIPARDDPSPFMFLDCVDGKAKANHLPQAPSSKHMPVDVLFQVPSRELGLEVVEEISIGRSGHEHV